MVDLDFSGLRERSRAAFAVNFDDVVRRARRRRRRRVRGAACGLAVATVLAGVAGASVALRPAGGLQNGGGVVVAPTPAYIPPTQPTRPPPRSGSRYARIGAMTAGDLSHLYLSYDDCQPGGCTPMVAASADAGQTWTRRRPPIPDNALFQLYALSADTLLVWYQTPGDGGVDHNWIASTDAGAQWRPMTISTLPAVPAGWRVLDFADLDASTVLAGDPLTGAVGQLLLHLPIAMGRALPGLPAAAGIWLTGAVSTTHTDSDPQTMVPVGSVLQVSHDGGVTWHRQVFSEPLDAHTDLGRAAVATYDGLSAYAVGEVGGTLIVYRTLDGGLTWQRAAERAGVGQGRISAAVGADGVLTIQVGDQAADHPIVLQSIDEGQTLRPVALGPGAAAIAIPGGYAQSGWPASNGVWLSDDGVTWGYAGPPALP